MRLRRSGLVDCKLMKTLRKNKDGEGNVIETFCDPINIKADIWDASSRLQVELYGTRITKIKNMLYNGKEVITEGDGICLNTESKPDYKVISVKGKTVKTIEIERIL